MIIAAEVIFNIINQEKRALSFDFKKTLALPKKEAL